MFSNSVTSNVLFSMKRQREAAVFAGISLLANVMLNAWLIPTAGATGAAIASVGSYSIVPVLAKVFPSTRWVGTAAIGLLARPMIAAGMAGCVLLALRPEIAEGVVLIAVAYAAALIMGRRGRPRGSGPREGGTEGAVSLLR